MKPNWLSDARLIPDEVMDYIRKIAVHAVKDLGCSPEDVVKIMNLSRSCIYDWLNRFSENGYDGLNTKKAPGAPPIITSKMDEWLKQTIINHTPLDFGYDTALWTCNILAALLHKQFKVRVVAETVNHHLHSMDLIYQKPEYSPKEQKTESVDKFLNEEFPKIQRFASKIGADIGFEDEASVDLRDHSGKTWGNRGKRPQIFVTGRRGRFNILSVVTAKGKMNYHIEEHNINSRVFVKFLKQLINNRLNPIILILDQAPFHKAKIVRRFVWCNRRKIRLHFLPSYSPKLNPDEHVWEEIKDKNLCRCPAKNKKDLKSKLTSALRSLQKTKERVISFFHLKDTLYAA